VLSVEVQPREDSVRLTAVSMDDLDRAIARAGVEVRVFLDSAGAVDPLYERLEREGRGKGKVKLLVPVGDGREAEIELPHGYAVSQAGRSALKEIPGVAAVELV